MPLANMLLFSDRYVATSGVADARTSALNLLLSLLSLQGVSERHLKDQLSSGLWKWTEAEGIAPHPKYNLRFVTAGVLDSDGTDSINHEHVWTRKWLIGRLRGRDWDPVSLREFLDQYGVACVVTVAQHAALGNQAGEGWRGYISAGIPVVDRQSGDLVDLEEIETTGVVTVNRIDARTKLQTEEKASASLLELIETHATSTVRDLFTDLLRMVRFASAVAAPSYTTSGEASAYFRIHDTMIGEPTAAVAYPHWTGNIHFRLTTDDLAPDLKADSRVKAVKSPQYAVGCKVKDGPSLLLAEELLFQALQKLRADYEIG